MAVSSYVLIALAVSTFIVSCAADYSNGNSATSSASATSYTARSLKKRKCIKVKRCPKNEEFTYCTQSIGRAQYCSQYGQSMRYQDNTPTSCKEGCVCKEDYLRNVNGTCIPAWQCEANCAPSEVLDDCPADCASDYCPTSNADTSECERPDPDQCPSPVCKCRFNHRRATNGSCIPTAKCPPFDCSCQPNEEYDPCPPYCPTDDCSQATPSGECPKQFGNILIVLQCNPKCRCKKGFWRKDGICVPYRDCPNICPINEEYSECTQALCRAQNCTQKGKPIAFPMIAEGSCITGCICKEGFLRLQNGTCVAEDQCELPTCGDNEILDICPTDCRSDYCPTCEEDNERCPKPDTCPAPACKCAFNYRLDDNGKCIPTEDCPPFNCSARPNEQYTPCPPICPSDACGLPRVTGICPFRIGIRLECNPKCQCEDGYGRLDGTCVPFEECPDLCPKNEEYNSCTQAVCRPQNCSERNNPPMFCPAVKEGCKKGCVCKKEYYRNENGTCVTDNECAKICPPYEEYVPCIQGVCRAMNCGQRGEDIPCPDRSWPEEECDAGYISNICPINEEYSECTQALCRAQNCTQKGKPIACPMIAEGSCITGCVCKEGFLRLQNGTCVAEDQCELPTCGDNEILDICPTDCRSDYCPTCEEDNKRCPKPDPCPAPACKCAFNYRRDDNGKCIPTEDCPPFNCSARPNEQYTPCPPICPSDACGLPRVTGTCPFRIRIRLECNPKCQCEDGYGRSEGTCVPFEECPDLCPKNEEYNSCTQAVCRPQNCSERNNPPMFCPVVKEGCKKGCVCKKEYYRNENGTCVTDNECGPLCPNPHEEYKISNKPNCPIFDTCTSIVARINCQEPKVPGCICQSGYLRLNETSTCIPICQCPQMANMDHCQNMTTNN